MLRSVQERKVKMYLGKAEQNSTKISLFSPKPSCFAPSMYCHWVNGCEGVLGTGKLVRVNTSSMFITHLSPSYCRDCPTGCSTEASKNNLSMQWSIGLSSPRCLADWRFNMKLCISGLCDCRHVLFYYVSSNTDLKKFQRLPFVVIALRWICSRAGSLLVG